MAQNTPPFISNGIPNQHAVTGQNFSYTFSSSAFKDLETKALRYSASNLPTGITFDKNTRTIKGRPTSSGKYNITITATDALGESISKTFSLFCHDASDTYAAFTMNIDQGCNFQKVNFTNKSGKGTSWKWDFGNGNTSVEKNPSAIYTQPGTYTVTLRINNGNSGNLVYTDQIRIFPTPDPQISVSNANGCAPLDAEIYSTGTPVQINPYTFEGSSIEGISSADENSYQWSFHGKLNPQITTSPTLTLNGIKENIDIIQLKITDKQGCEGSTYLRDPFDIYPRPEISFSVNKEKECEPSKTTFIAQTTSSAAIQQYIWKLDGIIPSERSNILEYKFDNFGEYIISVQAIAENRCNSLVYTDTIRFNDNNTADFSYISECVGDSSEFTLIANNVSHCTWNFGDGNTSIQKNPKHIYASSGNFDVSVLVTFTDGCSKQVNKIVRVDGIDIDIESKKLFSCLGDPFLYQFTDKSTVAPAGNAITKRKWFLLNNITNTYELKSTNEVCTISFATIGHYKIKLEVESTSGCQATFEKEITITEPAVTFETNSSLRGCLPHAIDFISSFYDEAQTAIAYDWDFDGDGTVDESTTTGLNSHIYTTEGVFQPRITIRTLEGCTFTKALNVNITSSEPPIISNITYTQVPNKCRTDSVKFTITHSLGTDTIRIETHGVSWTYSIDPTVTTSTISFLFPKIGTNIPLNFQAFKKGCASNTVTYNEVSINKPTADFRPTQSTFCAEPYEAKFIDMSNVTNSATAKYSWNFGNGETSTSKDPGTISYSNPDNYNVSLKVTDPETGCSDEQSMPLYIYKFDKSEDLIWADETIGCHPVQTTFGENISSKISNNLTIDAYKWDFNGDGIIDDSTSVAPTYTYEKPGLYDLSLTVYAQNGCKYNITRNDYINIKGPLAQFNINETTTCEGVVLNLENNSYKAPSDPHEISSYYWSTDAGVFIDGTNASSISPKLLFTKSDSVHISLLVENSENCIGQITQSDSVYVEEWDANFSATQDTFCLGHMSTFTNLSIGNVSSRWNFGDGGSSTTRNATHEYEQIGNYTVTLTTTNSRGCKRSMSKLITIVEGTADFYVPEPGCAPAFAYFVPKVDANLVQSYLWNFGNGETSTERMPGYMYQKPGYYTVSLKVTLRSGCSYSLTKIDSVFVDGPDGDFTYDATSACSNASVQFVANQLYNLSGLTWDFGDGITKDINIGNANADTIDHVYTSNGSRTPSLILHAAGATCSSLALFNSALGQIKVSDAPIAYFTSTAPDGICEDISVTFNDISRQVDPIFAINQWLWDFGDGTSSTEQNPEHSFSESGTYTITLTVTNEAGCSSSTSKTYTVAELDDLYANFEYDPVQTCPGTPITFTSLSTSANGSIESYDWDFGDGSQSQQIKPKHTYANTGSPTKTITLTVSDSKQCKTSIDKSISINSLDVDFVHYPSTIYRGNDVSFYGQIDNQGGSEITGITWNFESGVPNSIQGTDSPNAIKFDTIGTGKVITLLVTNSDGCETLVEKSINILNNPPTVTSFSTDDIFENSSITFDDQIFILNFNANDANQKLEKIKFSTLPTNGKLYLNSTEITIITEIPTDQIDQISFVPNANWNGDINFNWNGFDGFDWAVTPAAITIVVKDLTSDITILNWAYRVQKNEELTIPANDLKTHFGYSVQNDQLQQVHISELPQNGTLKSNGKSITSSNNVLSLSQLINNPLTFIPNEEFIGTTTIKWRGSDGTNYAPSEGIISIQYYNYLPEIQNIEYTIAKDSTLNIQRRKFEDNFSDQTPSDQTFKKIQITRIPNDSGTLTMNGIKINEYDEFTYEQLSKGLVFTPNRNFQGTTQFQWNAFDGSGYANNSAWVTIKYVNNVPSMEDLYFEIEEDETLYFTTENFKEKFHDKDKYDTLHSIIIRKLTWSEGTIMLGNKPVEINEQILSSELDDLKFVPTPNFSGEVQFKVNASDGIGLANFNNTITISIKPVNDAPVAVADSFFINEDQIISSSLADNDRDVDNAKNELSYQLITNVANVQNEWGIPILETNGKFSFTPKKNYFNETGITLSYRICDLENACDTADIFIVIHPINDPPVAMKDEVSVFMGIPKNINVLNNDYDVDGTIDPSTLKISQHPKKGTASANNDSTITYKGTSLGKDTLRYEIRDNENSADYAWVYITILNPAEKMAAVNDHYSTWEDTPIEFEPAENDIHIQSNYLRPSTIRVVVKPKNGTVLEIKEDDSFNGRLQYKPNDNYYGQDSLKYEISDMLGNKALAWIFITIDQVNDAPITEDFEETTLEDTPIEINLAIHATDADGDLDPNSATILDKPKHGMAIENGNGHISYIPNLNYYGKDTLSYLIYDKTDLVSNIAHIYITITPDNDPPFAENDHFSTQEDTPILIDVLANDYDPDENLNRNSLKIINQPQNGIASVQGEQIQYKPNNDFFGADQFTYAIFDETNLSDTAIVSIEVIATTDAPRPQNDSIRIDENTNCVFGPSLDYDGLLDNDIEVDGDDIYLTSIIYNGVPSSPNDTIFTQYGQLTWNAEGHFKYCINTNEADTLRQGDILTEEFSCVVTDTTNLSAESFLIISIYGKNDPPVAVSDMYEITESSFISKGIEDDSLILSNDYDIDSNQELLKIIAVNNNNSSTIVGQYGTLTWYENGTFKYEPNIEKTKPLRPGDSATDMFDYMISDEYGATANSNITFTIWGENNPPECQSDTIEVVFKGINSKSILENDSDPDFGDILSITELRTESKTLNTQGSLVGKYGELFWNPQTDTVIFTPAGELIRPLMPDELVIDEYYYTVSDGEKTCNSTIFVYIVGENDPITANNDSVMIDEDEYIQNIEVLENDEDPDNHGEGNYDYGSLRVTLPPLHGKSFVNTANGTLSYFPDENFNGKDSLKYKICDMGNLCDEAWVFITVNPVNDPPEAAHLLIKTTVGVSITFDGSKQVTDVDGNLDLSTLAITDHPSHGKSTNAGTSSITYTPDNEYTGLDEFTYTIADTEGESAYVIVTAIIAPDASTFFAQDDHVTTDENVPTSIYALANDTIGDVFPNPLSTSIIVHPKNGIASYDIIEHCIHYSPKENFHGMDTLQYLVSGDNGQYDMASVIIEVRFLNDQIVARDDFYKTTIGTFSISLPVLDNDSDPDSDRSMWKIDIVSMPKDTEGKIILDKTTNNITFYPANGYSGTVSFSYKICDGEHLPTCDMATVYILVKPIPNNLFAVNDFYTTNQNEAFTLDPHPIENDSLGLIDAPTFVLFDDAQHGIATENGDGTITYVPDPNYFGPDWIHYRICQNINCDFGEINIWVNEVNIPPVAQNDSLIVAKNEERRLLILANDFDIDGKLDYQSLKLETLPKSGNVTLDKNTGSILYKPNTNAAIDEFIYKICDDKGDCSTATVTINVDLGSTILTKQTLYEDCSDTLDIKPLMEKFNLFFNINQTTSIESPQNGASKTIGDNTKVVYTPNANYFGSDFYSIKLCDATGSTCANLQVNVTVLPVNDAPIAYDDYLTWDSTNKQFTFEYASLLLNDSDIEGDSIYLVPEILEHAPELNLSYNSDGTLTLKADTIYWCEAWFEYKIADSWGATAIGKVYLQPILTGIVARTDSVITEEDQDIVIDVLANDDYTDGQRCTIDTISLIAGPFNGTASIIDSLNVHYTPTPSFWGEDSIQYSLTDLWGQCDTTWIFIHVNQENMPPIAINDEGNALFGDPLSIPILANDSDQDEDGYIDTLRTYISLPPTLGTVAFDSNTGTMIYTSSLESCENDRFEYTIFDNEGDSATASVTIIMGMEAPIFPAPDTVWTYPGLAVQVFPLANDSGYFEPYIYQYFNPENGYIVLNGTDALTYTPDPDFIGRDSIIYQIQSICGNTEGEKILFIVEELRVPEIISPNDDGKNDFLIIDGIEYFPDCLFQIYNRLGHIVYEQYGYKNQWNGFSNRGSLFGDETLPSGTYYYTLRYNNGNNNQEGIIYIFR